MLNSPKCYLKYVLDLTANSTRHDVSGGAVRRSGASVDGARQRQGGHHDVLVTRRLLHQYPHHSCLRWRWRIHECWLAYVLAYNSGQLMRKLPVFFHRYFEICNWVQAVQPTKLSRHHNIYKILHQLTFNLKYTHSIHRPIRIYNLTNSEGLSTLTFMLRKPPS